MTKPSKCKHCGSLFQRHQSFQTWCSPTCGAEIGRAKLAKIKAKEANEMRRKDATLRIKLKTRRDWIKEAQVAVNKFIRARDRGRGCISCGVPLKASGPGGGFDAGHYRSIGAAPHLRFDHTNIHGQCKRCNNQLAGNAVQYRAGLIGRIGQQAVDALEADQTPRKWLIPELIEMRDTNRAWAKELIERQE